MWASSVNLKELRGDFNDICLLAAVVKKGSKNCFTLQF